MDSKELRGLYETYSEMYTHQQIDEAVKGESSERRKDLAAERKAGHRPLPAKEGEKYASHKLAQMAYAKRKRMGEEVDIFDTVLEFLQVEGIAETIEEAEMIMANDLNAQDIEAILEAMKESEKDEEKEDDEKEMKKEKKGKKEKEEKGEDEEDDDLKEASYSAKAARAGKDIGKPGKAFAKIAASAGKRYGSEERGKKVAGAILAKLRAKRG